MLCLAVEVNGEVSVVAGSAAAETLTARIELYPSVSESWLRVSGDLVSDDMPAIDAKWLGRALQLGDVVVVRVVQSDAPTAPALSSSDPSVNAAADGVDLVCSFCDKSHHEVTKMYAGPKAMICNECAAFMHQISVEQGAG